MRYIFVSDLHLSAERPDQVELFYSLIDSLTAASRLYILGDLFEIWLGDDDDSPPNPEIIERLNDYGKRGGHLFVMRGNRDFLYGEEFLDNAKATLLEDYSIVDLGGTRVLLTHGDLLCTKDVKYQAFRQFVRDEKNQAEFLSHPLAKRRLIAQQTQTGTKASMLEKDDFIMDVDQATVEQTMTEHEVSLLIHGHTHRPGDHTFELAGMPYQRMVLGDWYEQDSIICWQDGQFQRTTAQDLVAQLAN